MNLAHVAIHISMQSYMLLVVTTNLAHVAVQLSMKSYMLMVFIMNLAHFAVQISMKSRRRPKAAQGAPKGSHRYPRMARGTPGGQKGTPKDSQSGSKARPRSNTNCSMTNNLLIIQLQRNRSITRQLEKRGIHLGHFLGNVSPSE